MQAVAHVTSTTYNAQSPHLEESELEAFEKISLFARSLLKVACCSGVLAFFGMLVQTSMGIVH